jgi:hypothetical protein
VVLFSTDKDQFAGVAQIGGHTGGGGTPPNEGVGVPSRTERWGDALKIEPAAKAAVTAEMARIRFKVLSFPSRLPDNVFMVLRTSTAWVFPTGRAAEESLQARQSRPEDGARSPVARFGCDAFVAILESGCLQTR